MANNISTKKKALMRPGVNVILPESVSFAVSDHDTQRHSFEQQQYLNSEIKTKSASHLLLLVFTSLTVRH
jgi:hypothetical protein